ncbi:TfuA-like protein [Legionella pneumophila]|uniref:TfuA-like protein n=1 Tax=Legionella pneumophila TaxID=446 RepID=UPI0022B37147|nr:TfuA-like protein [Legionella pneumophila]MCZ4798232.1 TfuA-like protein [Legionella pneumophila]
MNNKKRAIFVDSTISHDELSEYIQDSDLLLPAIRRGDIIGVLLKHPSIEIIVIVDGVFEQQASVTHKEILWALEQGIKVIGLSSLGALRAYELRNYGMLGSGKVFEDYLSGVLDGDDEVAISYFPSTHGFDKTIAMVNIRATLEKLHLCDNNLICKLRKIHFKKRNWLTLKAAVPEAIFVQLKAHYIDQKKKDVLLYFQKNHQSIKSEIPIVHSSKNIYIIRDLANKMYPTLIDYLEKNLQSMASIPIQSATPFLEKIAHDIVIYLEYKKNHTHKITYILNELDSFSYKQTRLKIVSDKIRREQKLFLSSDFIKFLDKKKISKSNLTAIFDGILKLESYFLSNGHLFNTL